MMTASGTLFSLYAQALNREIAARGGSFRIDARPAKEAGMVQLRDSAGQLLGLLPDHTDAATIAAIERLNASVDRPA